MLLKYFVCVLIVASVASSAIIDDPANGQNGIVDADFTRATTDYTDASAVNAYGNSVGSTWIETARNALSGPAGQMVVHMAKEMINRSAGNSQVKNTRRTNKFVRISHDLLLSFLSVPIRFWVWIWRMWWYCYCWKRWYSQLDSLEPATGDNMDEHEVSIVSKSKHFISKQWIRITFRMPSIVVCIYVQPTVYSIYCCGKCFWFSSIINQI